MKKYSILILLALLCQTISAQVLGEVNVLDRDVFYFQYTPENKISDDINYQKWSTKLSIPPIRLNKLTLFNTFGLDVHKFNYNNDFLSNSDQIDRFYNINYSLLLNYSLSSKWSLNSLITPFVLSNLKGSLSKDDFDFNGNLFLERTFLREKGGYFQLAFGIGYMTLNGKKQISPIVNLKARLNEKWSFGLGLPNTYVKWDINEKHSLKLLGDLNDFSANLSGDNNVLNNTNIDRAVFTTISGGLEYNYWVTPSVGIMLKGTYPIWGDYELRDNNDDTILNLNTSFKQPFIGVGIKFNPIRNLQNALNPL